MGILRRIKSIVAAEANDLLDQVEKPIAMLNQYIREAEEDLARGQKALANQLFLEKKQETLIQETKGVLSKRNRQAKLAVERGEDQIAKIALQEKLLQEAKLTQYVMQYEAIKAQTVELTKQFKQFQEKLDELKHRRLLLVSKIHVTQSLKQINRTFAPLNTDHIAKGFAQVEERILMMEAELEAGRQLATPSGHADAAMVDPAVQEQVEKELQALKDSRLDQ